MVKDKGNDVKCCNQQITVPEPYEETSPCVDVHHLKSKQCCFVEENWCYIILQHGCVPLGSYRICRKARLSISQKNKYGLITTIPVMPYTVILASNKGIGAATLGFISAQCTQFLVFSLPFNLKSALFLK